MFNALVSILVALTWAFQMPEQPSGQGRAKGRDQLFIEHLGEEVPNDGNFVKGANDLRVQQCFIPLPVNGPLAFILRKFKHTYIKVLQTDGTERTYGMPYGEGASYIGNKAFIYSPDPFAPKTKPGTWGKSEEECLPVHLPTNQSPEDFSEFTQCIAERFSFNGHEEPHSWIPQLYYAYNQVNCSSAVRLILECAGGRVARHANVHAEFRYNYKENFEMIQDGQPTAEMSLFQMCELARKECQ